MKINESNVTIMVQDMDAAIQFYQSIGLQIKGRWENHYAMLSAPGITIGLHPGGAGEGSAGLSIGFMIDDIAETKALLEAQGITCQPQDDGKSGSYLHFKDPDNTALYFVKPQWGE